MTSTSNPETTTTLAPSYAIPVGLGLLAVVGLVIQPWLGGAIALFALFLLYQTRTLRLVFTQTDLDVYRGETRIRRFPYAEWQTWSIFWRPVPILFYFREINSIHFLPILFQPEQLRAALETHVPDAETPADNAES